MSNLYQLKIADLYASLSVVLHRDNINKILQGHRLSHLVILEKEVTSSVSLIMYKINKFVNLN
jgi:hypothetical protein